MYCMSWSLDVFVTFKDIGLIDTYGFDPHDECLVFGPQMAKGGLEIRSHIHLSSVEFDWFGRMRITLGI